MKDNKKPNQNDNRRQNLTGVVTLIIWSLIITIGINYVIGHTANRGSVEIKFSELVEMVKEDQVTEVKLESGKYTVTLTEEGEAMRDRAVEVPYKMAQCVNLAPEEASELYRLLYKLLG